MDPRDRFGAAQTSWHGAAVVSYDPRRNQLNPWWTAGPEHVAAIRQAEPDERPIELMRKVWDADLG